MSGSEWNEDRVNKLKSMWADGYSSGRIAQEFGVTRNTIAGKAHRLGLRREVKAKMPPKPKRALPVQRNRRVQPRPLVQVPIIACVEVSGEEGISLLDLEHHHCRAIIGHGPDGLARYCGIQKEGTIRTRSGASMVSAYCRGHGVQFYNRAHY